MTLNETDLQMYTHIEDVRVQAAWKQLLNVDLNEAVSLLADLNRLGCLATYACRQEVIAR